MSFGGSVQAMITILKNNANMRNKRKRFNRSTSGYNKSKKKTEYNLPKASAKQLREIRKQMKSERKLWWVKAVILTLIIFVALLSLLFINASRIREHFW